MKTLKIDEQGDLEFDNTKNLAMVDGTEEVRQRNKLRIGTNQGEWFLNLRFGIPWLKMLRDQEPPSRFRAEIARVLNDDPAIDSIEEINVEFSRENRNLRIEFIAIVDGEKIREEVVI